MSAPDEAPERRIPFEGPRGWGVALFIVALSAALYFTAYSIHKATYKNPRDPTDVPAAHADITR